MDYLSMTISKGHRVPLGLFLLLCLNLLLAPAVQAATSVVESRFSAYTITLLGLVTLCLCVYLFVVIFQPERF
jgi:K+-transporting ATPase KdpF subunit